MIFPQPSQMCWICGHAVTTETRTIDQHGSTVHERCYAARLALASEALKLGKMSPRPAPPPKRTGASSAR